LGTVAITNSRKTDTIGLNGAPMSLGSALAKFLGVEEDSLEGQLAGQHVRLNSTTVEIPEGFTTALRDYDFISVVTDNVARGGIKGAHNS